ncbi:choice-of-anchor Q domain-containing protein [Paenibacillus sp. GCM10012307]|uniref:Right-handed parallel beta-helix repeat-containing protein n=1 Tax=Paenibacillus roseus TaxID=2798579 RepID=A0A934JBJ2_9BACL|nr:right-handed parallel beta-helix repeat-containing protein [Paenibacillus roseus]MBJ6364027.1 right-handed parallel beta-helix repeat-containing protein [Paenibacillus roseus]
MKKLLSIVVSLCMCFSIFVVLPQVTHAAGTTYYVDSVSGNDSNNGTSTSSAWKTLSKVSNTTFSPGDEILLKRGATFAGMAWPKGSGQNQQPITLGAYGTGNRPIINGGTNEAAIKLQNQQYWVIKDLETTGGNPRGISIGNDSGNTLNYFRILNSVVHDVGGVDTTKPGNDLGKKQGLIAVWAPNGSKGSHFNDVIIDGSTAYSTQRWSGIMVYSNASADDTGGSTNISIRNSTVYDVYGDGIAVFSATDNSVMESNVVYDIGKAPTDLLGTPNGIWTWRTNNAIVRYNEVYQTHSPGVDGGAFDIDYYNTNNWVEYNYAHDNDAYGVAVFGATDDTVNGTFTGVTNNAIVRYNIFSNNGREAGNNGSGQGDFYVLTWAGGSIDGLQIYNNTSYWNPARNDYAVKMVGANFVGSNPKIFKNNLIYSTVPKIVAVSNNTVSFDHNLYWYTGSNDPEFNINNTSYNSFASYREASGQDLNSIYADPKLNTPSYHSIGKPTTQFELQNQSPAINAGVDVNGGARDFLGNNSLQGGAFDIGAIESSFSDSSATNLIDNPGFEADGPTPNPSGWSTWSGSNTPNASYTEGFGGSHGGSYHLTHYNGQNGSWNVYTYKTITGLANGYYTLTAWARKSGNGFSVSRMEAKDFGSGSTLTANIPSSSNYQKLTISGIKVTNGTATIGFYTQVDSGSGYPFVYIDDVRLVKN